MTNDGLFEGLDEFGEMLQQVNPSVFAVDGMTAAEAGQMALERYPEDVRAKVHFGPPSMMNLANAMGEAGLPGVMAPFANAMVGMQNFPEDAALAGVRTAKTVLGGLGDLASGLKDVGEGGVRSLIRGMNTRDDSILGSRRSGKKDVKGSLLRSLKSI